MRTEGKVIAFIDAHFTPSSGPSGHLLPDGAKGMALFLAVIQSVVALAITVFAFLPLAPWGEGGRRETEAGEGAIYPNPKPSW